MISRQSLTESLPSESKVSKRYLTFDFFHHDVVRLVILKNLVDLRNVHAPRQVQHKLRAHSPLPLFFRARKRPPLCSQLDYHSLPIVGTGRKAHLHTCVGRWHHLASQHIFRAEVLGPLDDTRTLTCTLQLDY